MIETLIHRDDLFRRLDRLGAKYVTHSHPPLFTVGEGEEIKRRLPGGHTKNLFLKDAKGRLWLVSALSDARIDLKALPQAIGSGRLSFASPDRLWSSLGVRPGSVSPFALINDVGREVTFVLDRSLAAHATLNFHPLVNTATTAIDADDFLEFLADLGVQPIFVDFPNG